MPSKQARAAMMSSIRDPLCLYTFYENVIARVQGLHGDVSFCGTPSFIVSWSMYKPDLKKKKDFYCLGYLGRSGM